MVNKNQEFTLRQWNPKQIKVAFDQDNGSSVEASCPMTLICCYVVEKLFKVMAQETINEVRVGLKSTDEVFALMIQESYSTTVIFRFLSWALSILGHWLLFMPIINLMAWIPLVGHLLSSILSFAAIIFAFIWASMVHLIVFALAWLYYRPLFGILMISLTVMGAVALLFGH